MAKVTIELDDNLIDDVLEVQGLVKDEFLEYLKDNKPSSCPDMSDLDHNGSIHEIVDGSVPVCTRELESAWFLHSSDLESTLDSAGLYSDEDLGKLSNEQKIMSAYYCYLMDAVNEWLNDEAETLYDEWVASGQNDYDLNDIVFWNDPDQGLTSRNATITAFIDGKVILDNGEIEALADELEAEHDIEDIDVG